MALVDDLRAARALIDTPDKWGHVVPWGSDRKCASEALDAIRRNDTELRNALVRGLPLIWRLKGRLQGLKGLPEWRIVRFNDAPTTTHNAVLALFDRAIKAAEATA